MGLQFVLGKRGKATTETGNPPEKRATWKHQAVLRSGDKTLLEFVDACSYAIHLGQSDTDALCILMMHDLT